VRDPSGASLDPDDVIAAHRDAARAHAAVADDPRRSVADGVEAWIAEEGLGVEQADLLRFVALRVDVELDDAAPADQLSAQASWEMAALRGGDVVPAGGYAPLVDALAEGLDARLADPVVSVAWGEGGVVVSTASGAAHAGSHAIVAVPVGVLASGAIAFDPPLPAGRVDAWGAVGVGALEKTILAWETRWWSGGGPWALVDPEPALHPACGDLSAHAGAPVIACFTGGAASWEGRRELDDDALVADALAALSRMVGAEAPPPTATRVTRWADDPWARGSYSHVRVGGSLAELEALAEPIGGRVLFAGEHTAGPWHQTVHGALISGLREAARLGADPCGVPGACR
jgi:monoamine oxidase